MPTTKRLLELALKGLEADRDRIDQELQELRQQMGGTGSTSHTQQRQTTQRNAAKMAAPRRRRTMSPAARKLISKRMREVWAQRKKAA